MHPAVTEASRDQLETRGLGVLDGVSTSEDALNAECCSRIASEEWMTRRSIETSFGLTAL
jgi:hypothetical protein